MPSLTKSEYLELLEEWLDCWREAGCPVVQPVIGSCATTGSELFRVEVVSSVQQYYGIATKMRLWLGRINMTGLLSKLTQLRLCKGETINVRTGSGVSVDTVWLIRIATQVHLDAARAHWDADAYRASGLPLPAGLEDRLFNAKLIPSAISRSRDSFL